MSPVLSIERIAHLSDGRRLLRCGISVWPMTASGQNRKGSVRANLVRLPSGSGPVADILDRQLRATSRHGV
jgi:hypothetical protein